MQVAVGRCAHYKTHHNSTNWTSLGISAEKLKCRVDPSRSELKHITMSVQGLLYGLCCAYFIDTSLIMHYNSIQKITLNNSKLLGFSFLYIYQPIAVYKHTMITSRDCTLDLYHQKAQAACS